MINLLLKAHFKEASECFGFSLVVGISAYLVDSLKGTVFSNIVILFFRLLCYLAMDKLKLSFRVSVVLPILDMLSEVSPENSINDAQRSFFTVVQNSL
jgi:hypothetical protein